MREKYAEWMSWKRTGWTKKSVPDRCPCCQQSRFIELKHPEISFDELLKLHYSAWNFKWKWAWFKSGYYARCSNCAMSYEITRPIEETFLGKIRAKHPDTWKGGTVLVPF